MRVNKSQRRIWMIRWGQMGAKLANRRRQPFRTIIASTLALFLSVCLIQVIVLSSFSASTTYGQVVATSTSGQQQEHQHILTGHHNNHNQQQQQQQQDAAASFEQQLAALVTATVGGANQGGQSLQVPMQMDPISAVLTAAASQPQKLLVTAGAAASVPSEALPAQPRSRSPRSIGEMFKKFFTSNKRSKQSSQASQSANRDWEQQQQLQQQQQFQQNQAATMAATLAAAAANQHAVYASPFATYTPQSSASALYPQFAPAYSSAGLVAWPATTASLAQALRATPTLIAAQTSPAIALTSTAGPLYAAASQSYNSYVAPPPQVQQQSQQQQQAQQQQVAQSPSVTNQGLGNPVAAASYQHASTVPAPSGHNGGVPNSALDFHQVLDAFVRTSGFAPAGDQEATAASGYGAKTDGTPVFSFKKLVSLPFYLSTEEKSLDGLANAGPAAGYSPHSMPIMRRHVRRMSTPASQQQQQAAAVAALQQADSRRERAQMQQFNSYINAVNNQLASMTANQQLMHYLNQQQQQSQPSFASPLEAYSAETVLANFQALANQQQQASYKSSGIGNRNAASTSSVSGGSGANLATAASVVTPMAVQPPQGLFHQQQQSAINQNQQQQQQEIQSILSQLAPSGEPYSATSFASYPSSQFQSLTDGHRLGAQQQQYFYWGNNGNNQQLADVSGSPGINVNGNDNVNNNGNNGQDYLVGQLAQANSLGQQQQQFNSMSSSQQQQQQQLSHSSATVAGNSQPGSALSSSQASNSDSNAPGQQQQINSGGQQSQMSTQQAQQQSSLVGSQQQKQQQLSSGANLVASGGNSNGFAAQIEGQQQK